MTRNDDASTPLTDDELVGIRLHPVPSRNELNLIELRHISLVMDDPRWMAIPTTQFLDDLVLRRLHRDMFSEVWTWAGKYRTTEKNIGCDPREISVRVRDLCESAKLWFGGGMAPDEAGCRFHQQLVAIHPFVNGNGRHARLATDIVLESIGVAPFTWGGSSLVDTSAARATYISALRSADRGDIGPLLAFVRT